MYISSLLNALFLNFINDVLSKRHPLKDSNHIGWGSNFLSNMSLPHIEQLQDLAVLKLNAIAIASK